MVDISRERSRAPSPLSKQRKWERAEQRPCSTQRGPCSFRPLPPAIVSRDRHETNSKCTLLSFPPSFRLPSIQGGVETQKNNEAKETAQGLPGAAPGGGRRRRRREIFLLRAGSSRAGCAQKYPSKDISGKNAGLQYVLVLSLEA